METIVAIWHNAERSCSQDQDPSGFGASMHFLAPVKLQQSATDVNKRHDCCLSSFSVSDSFLRNCKYSLRDASQCIAQPNTTLLDCILYPMQYLYDPGTLPSSANQCILGKVCLRSNLSRELQQLLISLSQHTCTTLATQWTAHFTPTTRLSFGA